MAGDQPTGQPTGMRSAAGASPPAVSAAAGDTRSTAEVVRDIADATQTIVKKEIELAKLELSEKVADLGKGIAAFAAAGLMALYLLAFIAVTGAKALEEVVAPWLAWLIVTLVFLVITLVAALVGRAKVNRAQPLQPEKTQRSVQENVTWVKQQLRR